MSNLNPETFIGNYIIDNPGNHRFNFATAQKYVNKNIILNVDVPAITNISFQGGNLSASEATIDATNATFSSADQSGIAVTALGKIDRTAISYNGTYNGWIENLSGEVLSAITNNTWEGTTYYLTDVELKNNTTFNITVPNGGTNKITFHFSVDSNGNTTIT